MTFEEFFTRATEQAPFPYQVDLATGHQLPDLLQAPTGAGKTAAAVLGWLWRRRFAEEPVRSATPRRLVYCLPMRVLVEQTRDNAESWLKRLGLAAGGDNSGSCASPVNLTVLMGGEEPARWDLQPERDAIIIGTQDMLLSRALNRGYGMSRYRWPLHFALLGNDCLWVYDEVQLMGPGLASSAQLAAFRSSFGGFGPMRQLWMSATLKSEWLETYDLAPSVPHLAACELGPADRASPELAERLIARKPISSIEADISKSVAMAEAILAEHRSKTLTLVVVNTVARATKLYETVAKCLSPGKRKRGQPDDQSQPGAADPELLLIHSRFRPDERRDLIAKLQSEMPAQGRIVISTQVVEAGVDISAETLFTELAPWPSLVQRFGRCNRYGKCEEARVFWVDLTTSGGKSQAPPYADNDLDCARNALAGLADVGILSLESHISQMGEASAGLYSYETDHLLRRRDFLELFDTTADLAGGDIDISRFIRDGTETDAQVFWRHVPSGQVPDAETVEGQAPSRNELCSVPLRELREFFKSRSVEPGAVPVFVWDILAGCWKKAAPFDIAPGRSFLVPCSGGGYYSRMGWSVNSRAPVTSLASARADKHAAPEANDSEMKTSKRQTLREHTEEVAAELDALLGQLKLPLDNDCTSALFSAARWHDRGKAHPVCQEALSRRDSTDGERLPVAPRPAMGELLAKSGYSGQLRYRRKGFRHELPGALAALQAGLPELACYLVAAHHGKVRLSIRSLPQETRPRDTETRFARGVWDGDVLPEADLGGGHIAPEVTLSLQPSELGLSSAGEPSWADRMLRLRDEAAIGPYRLAFLESLLRVADERASAKAAQNDVGVASERQPAASSEMQQGGARA